MSSQIDSLVLMLEEIQANPDAFMSSALVGACERSLTIIKMLQKDIDYLEEECYEYREYKNENNFR